MTGFQCGVCRKGTSTMTTMREHQRMYHPEIWLTPEAHGYVQCDICQLIFKSQRGLVTHKSERHNISPRNPFKCSLCFKNFPKEEDLKTHKEAQHGDNKPNVLDEDLAMSSDSSDEASTKEKTTSAFIGVKKIKVPPSVGRHECDVCGRTYQTKRNLTRHQREKHDSAKEMEQTAIDTPTSLSAEVCTVVSSGFSESSASPSSSDEKASLDNDLSSAASWPSDCDTSLQETPADYFRLVAGSVSSERIQQFQHPIQQILDDQILRGFDPGTFGKLSALALPKMSGSIQLSKIVCDLLDLKMNCLTCDCQMFVLLETTAEGPVIVFAVFCKEFANDESVPERNRGTVFITHFGTPRHLPKLQSYSRLCATFLYDILAYYGGVRRFRQGFIGSGFLVNDKGYSYGDEDLRIFNQPLPDVLFSKTWLRRDVLGVAKDSSVITDHRELAPTFPSQLPLFVDRLPEDWSSVIDKRIVKQLNMDRTGIFQMLPSPKYTLIRRMLIDLLYPGYDVVYFANDAPDCGMVDVSSDEQQQPGKDFFADARSFMQKSKLEGWEFDTLENAQRATAAFLSAVCTP